ncbi:hypothetical protein ABT009_25715 [Streptomyces sp. NPDC002896]|uniref:hypothetical protein n=1 Tax=Streptomyces sp. NPDC002896 TaxID=3154438 RepID=UPI00332CEAD6
MPAAVPASAADKPAVTLSKSEAGAGGSLTVTGKGWRPKALLMLLICGQSAPGRGVIGGTNSCANGDGRAVTTDGDGEFSRKLPVAEPPEPCPCVVHVATVTGEQAAADAVLKVAGHPVEPLPEQDGAGKLSVLTDTRLEGSSGILTWFGAPPGRQLVFTVGNVGSAPVKDPVFQVGTSHGVFAPQWEEQQWRGTIAPGKKARIKLPVELAAGAHGDYAVSLRFGGKVLAEQPWGVGRPWGVTLFWILLFVVVPSAVFRIGMAIVDRIRPRAPGGGGRHRGVHLLDITVRLPRLGLQRTPSGPPSATGTASTGTWVGRPRTEEAGGGPAPTATTTLPWFTPDTDPGAPAGRLSAPSELSAPPQNSPTTKGNT